MHILGTYNIFSKHHIGSMFTFPILPFVNDVPSVIFTFYHKDMVDI